jgi:hypothetical protein
MIQREHLPIEGLRAFHQLLGRWEVAPIKFGSKLLDHVGPFGRQVVRLGHVIHQVVECELFMPFFGQELPGSLP